jgi:beta-lysine 5,6-aminomutase alpha subunit
VQRESIWASIASGVFADVKRTRTGGKGHAGVVRRDGRYTNPLLDVLEGHPSGGAS